MLPQVLINAAVAGVEYALFGLSFALIYRTVKFFHFAHAVIFTFGAYAVFLLRTRLGFSFIAACVLGTAVSAGLGCLIELGIYRPMRTRRASAMTLLLSSLGVYVALQNVISLVFGDDTKIIRPHLLQEGIQFVGGWITPVRLTIVIGSGCLILGVSLFLRASNVGLMIRAVSDDNELATISGVQSARVILWVFCLGSALAGAAGILVGLDVDIVPTIGMAPFLMAVVAVIIGGVRSNVAVVLAGFLVGLVQQATTWLLSSLWQGAIVFILLIVFLLVRPSGISRSSLRSSSV